MILKRSLYILGKIIRQKGLVKLLVNLKFCLQTSIRSKRGPDASPWRKKMFSIF